MYIYHPAAPPPLALPRPRQDKLTGPPRLVAPGARFASPARLWPGAGTNLPTWSSASFLSCYSLFWGNSKANPKDNPGIFAWQSPTKQRDTSVKGIVGVWGEVLEGTLVGFG